MRARVLIDTDVHAPQALAVDPSMGVIFWTDVVVGRVYRSGIDGGQRVVRVFFLHSVSVFRVIN